MPWIPNTVISSSSGGSGAADPIFDAFGAPDDTFEFDTSSLTGITSMNTPGTLDADTTSPGHLYISATGTGFTLHGCYVTAPSMPFTVITRLKSPTRNSNSIAGMGVAEGTPGKIDFTGLHVVSSVRGPSRLTWTDPTASPGGPGQTFAMHNLEPVYIAIVANSSTDIDSYVSWDGVLWSLIADAVNPGLTIASVVLAVDKANSLPVTAAFEFLRVWNSALVFPGIA